MLAYFFMIQNRNGHVHRFRGIFFKSHKVVLSLYSEKTKQHIKLVLLFSFINKINQGPRILKWEGKCAADFSFNLDRAHLPVGFLKILKNLISMLGCVWLGLELNSVGKWISWAIFEDSWKGKKRMWRWGTLSGSKWGPNLNYKKNRKAMPKRRII